MTEPFYRTLIRGRLVQQSSLTVGGTLAVPGGPDMQCARDGQGRLTIPGTSLAGSLLQTAARICPALFSDDKFLDQGQSTPSAARLWRWVTGKCRHRPQPSQNGDEPDFAQSLWEFRPSHPIQEEEPALEWREGVGIRQRTGAAARDKRVLFNAETVPAGQQWDIFLEIDSLRCWQAAQQLASPAAASQLEQLLLLALREWTQGRCWLGANAARGQGWFRLVSDTVQVLRLPLTADMVDAWPDNTFASPDEAWQALCDQFSFLKTQSLTDAMAPAQWASDRHYYLTLNVSLDIGAGADPDDEYGLDVFSTRGQANPASDRLTGPLRIPFGVPRENYLAEEYHPDVILAHTFQTDGEALPLIPGSGLRGALRHMVSRCTRSFSSIDVADPNDGVHRTARDDAATQDLDPVSSLFGLETTSGRILVRDACCDPGSPLTLASLHHHAEDEFAASVFSSGKFERTVVAQGKFQFQIVFEAETGEQLQQDLRLAAPALQLAAQQMLPIGAAKWRGCGWIPWRVTEATLARAGDGSAQSFNVDQDVYHLLTEILRATGGDDANPAS